MKCRDPFVYWSAWEGSDVVDFPGAKIFFEVEGVGGVGLGGERGAVVVIWRVGSLLVVDRSLSLVMYVFDLFTLCLST